MSSITVRWVGRPQPKQRPRVYKGRAITPQKTRDFEDGFGLAARVARGAAPLLTGSIAVEVELVYKNRSRLGDIDNAAKALLDGLNGVAWEDDRLIDELTIRRSFGHDEEMAIVEVDILS